MLKNYIDIAAKLLKDKRFSMLHVSGVAVIITVVMLFVCRIYYLPEKNNSYSDRRNGTTSPALSSKVLKTNEAAHVSWPANYLFGNSDKKTTLNGNIVDKGFLSIFTFPLIKGNPKTQSATLHSTLIKSTNRDFTGKSVRSSHIKDPDAGTKTLDSVIKHGTGFTYSRILLKEKFASDHASYKSSSYKPG